MGLARNSYFAGSLVGMSLCAIFTGCSPDVRTVWSTEVPSPDGRYVATARTLVHGGPGTAGIETGVYLRQSGRQPLDIVLGFSRPEPNATTGSIDLTINWLDPNHLEIAFRTRPELYFQAIKYQGIVISVRDSSKASGDQLIPPCAATS